MNRGPGIHSEAGGKDPEAAAIARPLIWWQRPDEVDFLLLVRRVMNQGT